MPKKRKTEDIPADSSVSIKKLAEFTPDARNANKGTARGNALIKKSLHDYGAGRSILLDKNGNIIAGNKTAENAGKAELSNVLVVKTDGTRLVAVQRMDLDLNDKKARQLAIADNRASEVSLDWDIATLKGLQAEGVELDPFWSKEELAELWPDTTDLLEDEDAVPPVPATPITKPGDLYLMGGHRLLCGDSTAWDHVDRLMGGNKARLMATDPPYGVALRLEDNHEASNAAKGIASTYRHFEKIMGDDLNGPKLQEFLEQTFKNAIAVLVPDAAWYLWHAQMSQGFFAAAAAAADLLIHRQIIWVKPHFVFGRGDYHWQHELCFYGWRAGHRPKFYGKRNQSTTWLLKEGGGSIRRNQGHPTQKPVELFSRAILNHTKEADICLDLFGGSGSQMIAAEKNGRRCFMMEIDPVYCDVIVARWEQATGKKAVLSGA